MNVDSREERLEITFSNTYTRPVLFLQVVADGDPLSAQPVFVETTGALVSVTEGSDYDGVGAGSATLHWAVFEAGDYELADGRAAVIGAIESGTRSYDMADGTAIEARLELSAGSWQDFSSDAAVLAQPQRAHGNTWQAVRIERTTRTDGLLDWSTGTVEEVEVLDGVTCATPARVAWRPPTAPRPPSVPSATW